MHAVCRYVSLRLLLYHHRSIRGSELHDFWPAKWVDRLVGPAIGPFVLGFLPWKAEPMEDVGLWCQQTMLFFHLQARAPSLGAPRNHPAALCRPRRRPLTHPTLPSPPRRTAHTPSLPFRLLLDSWASPPDSMCACACACACCVCVCVLRSTCRAL